MEWEILPFVGMGPVRFGMSPSDVSMLIGPALSSEIDDEYLREYRAVDLPIVSYENDGVTEIEAFYDVKNVVFRGVNIFETSGLDTLRFLERENGGANMNVGVVLFNEIGITSGRLDEGAPGDHSITAFATGLWDDRRGRFKTKTFL